MPAKTAGFPDKCTGVVKTFNVLNVYFNVLNVHWTINMDGLSWWRWLRKERSTSKCEVPHINCVTVCCGGSFLVLLLWFCLAVIFLFVFGVFLYFDAG